MTTATRRTRGVAAGLSRESVVAAAEAVAERVGLDAMSLRAVAVELGVSPTAIYHHVEGKDELIDAVADAFVARLLVEPLPTEPLARVRELARRLRRSGLEHPGLLSAFTGRVPSHLPSAHVTYGERILSALVEAGADEATALLLYGVIIRLCLGDVVSTRNLNSPARVPLEERLRAVTEDPSLPLTTAMLRTHHGRRDETFDQHLDLVLQGLSRA